MRDRRGFTLLEMLISATIVSLVGGILAQTFFTMTRTNTKTERIKDVKQSGEFALEVMERMIRNARDVTSACTGIPSDTISIRNADGGSTSFTCVLDNGTPRIASRSGTIVDFLSSSSVTLGGSGCAASSFSITCTTSGGRPGSIRIAFQLSQLGTPADQFERSSVSFGTTLQLRNE